jgi:hypothetical protein
LLGVSISNVPFSVSGLGKELYRYRYLIDPLLLIIGS